MVVAMAVSRKPGEDPGGAVRQIAEPEGEATVVHFGGLDAGDGFQGVQVGEFCALSRSTIVCCWPAVFGRVPASVSLATTRP